MEWYMDVFTWALHQLLPSFAELLTGFFVISMWIFAQTLQKHIKNHTQKPCAGAHSRQRFETKKFLEAVLRILKGLINRGLFWFIIFIPSLVQWNTEWIEIKDLFGLTLFSMYIAVGMKVMNEFGRSGHECLVRSLIVMYSVIIQLGWWLVLHYDSLMAHVYIAILLKHTVVGKVV